MQTESLQALLIDRELGELSSEAVELLEAWLAEHAEATEAVPDFHRTCATAQAAVRRFPELVRPEPNLITLPPRRFGLTPLALAASLLVLLGGTAWVGFRAGRASRPETVANDHREVGIAPPDNAVKYDRPWAQYRLVPDPRGGLGVIRRHGKPPSES
jgi:hypothetical protein